MFAEKAARELLKHGVRLVARDRALVRRFGEVTFRTGPEDGPARWSLASGSFGMEVVRRLRQYLSPGDVFVDVGANVGYMAAHGADAVGRDGAVHLFEPVPHLQRRLRRLAADNPAHRFTLHGCAVGDVAGRAAMETCALPHIGKNTLVPGVLPRDAQAGRVEIAVRRLDEALPDAAVRRARVVKVDVEGFEPQVVRSARGLLDAGWRPVWVVELSPRLSAQVGEGPDAVEQTLAAYGYRPRRLTDLSPVRTADVETQADVLFLPVGTVA